MSVNHCAFKCPVQFTGRGPLLLFVTFIVLQSAWPAYSEAARLNRYLTSEDIAGRMILDQNGEQIAHRTAGDRHPALASGSIPTYLAIPLKGGEQLPGSIPTLDTGSQPGQNPAGPLDFDSVVKANLDATLSTSRLAVVDASTGNYLVEFLPLRGHSGSQNAVGGAGSTVSELANLLGTPQKQINKLTQGGMNEEVMTSATSPSHPTGGLWRSGCKRSGFPLTSRILIPLGTSVRDNLLAAVYHEQRL